MFTRGKSGIAFRFLLALALLAAAGCTAAGKTGSGTNGENGSFVREIWRHYPELKDKKMQTETINRVVDGDTFVIGDKQKVRLIGVDTPETVKPNTPVQRYGKAASDFTKKALTGKKVILFTDVSDKDKYGRLLRYVFIDGVPEMFNETLVKEGYAKARTVPPDVMYADTFVRDERDAREHDRGLWDDRTP